VARSVDGFLLAASRQPDDALVELAATRPVVLINRRVRDVASVVVEHTEGCRQIVAHLASLGHTSLVYLAGPSNSWMASSRWAAIRAAAAELGLAAQRSGPYAPTVSSGGAAADAAIGTRASAIIAHNDLLAIGVLRRLANRSVRVPADVSVVGFDDIFAADLCTPALTTLGGAHERVGRAAVEILLDGLATRRDRNPAPHVAMASQLIIRDSTGVASANQTSGCGPGR
jgi:LacI family transcriptional regulator